MNFIHEALNIVLQRFSSLLLMLLDYFHKFPYIGVHRVLCVQHKLNLLVFFKSISCFKVSWV